MKLEDFIVIDKDDGDTWVELLVRIKNNDKGNVVDYHTDGLWYDDEPGLFIWRDGNFKCDCNRGIFFDQANGKKAKEITKYKCGEKKYSVNIYNPVDMGLLYKEYEE